MEFRWMAAALSAALLAGCGGGSGDAGGGGPIEQTDVDAGEPVVAPPTAVGASLAPIDTVLGPLPDNLSIAYDPATGIVTLDDGNGPVALAISPSPFAPFALHAAPIPATGNFGLVARAETASGSGTASVVHLRGEGIAGVIFSRLSETQMPTSGSAAFSGRYHADLLNDSTSPPGIFNMRGDVALTADFGAGTISGEITNRTATSVFSEPVILSQTRISGGAFGGSATGGELRPSLVLEGTITSSGSYSGLFTGATGDEIVGGVRISHSAPNSALGGMLGGNQPLTEYGAFVAGRTEP